MSTNGQYYCSPFEAFVFCMKIHGVCFLCKDSVGFDVGLGARARTVTAKYFRSRDAFPAIAIVINRDGSDVSPDASASAMLDVTIDGSMVSSNRKKEIVQ